MSRQFDVHSNVFARSGGPPLLVNLQADHLAALRTVLTAPLWPATESPRLRFHVPVNFERRSHWLSTAEIAAIRRTALGPIMGNLEGERDRIVRALDFVFTGV